MFWIGLTIGLVLGANISLFLYAIILNIFLIILFVITGILLEESIAIIIIIFTISIISFSYLFYQIIKKL